MIFLLVNQYKHLYLIHRQLYIVESCFLIKCDEVILWSFVVC
jgi:hypothetical protein